ncbi:MAG: efflux RND transporter permease subunit [Clostridia bacterium]|nr:efflux RND transporter permease subunit [Clostridia bacterium]
MQLSSLSVKRPVAVVMAVLIFVTIGIYSLTMLDQALIPDMTLNYVAIITQYENVGAEEVENLVTETIESAVSSVSGVEGITSQSSEGMSMVLLELSSSVDLDQAKQDVKDSIELIEDYLPSEAGTPTVMKLDISNLMAAAQVSVSYEGYTAVQTKQYVEDNVENKLKSINGVASVSISGAEDREIQVIVDPEKMYGYNISVSSLVSAIYAQNQDLPAGTLDGLGKELSVRTLGKFDSVDEIESVPITTSTGQVIYISDVASVEDTYSEASSYARNNGDDALSISITGESDANTVELVNAIFDELDEICANNSKFHYEVVYEQGSYIENAVGSVAQNAVIGGVLAVIILILFLGSVRTGLVIGVTMPVSVVTTFIGMYFSGMTLNVVSLGGLALGVGMLVDNAIVVIENIFRRRTELGEDKKTAAIKGAAEVVGAVVASVLTTCIVYVPILFIDNMVAEMFKQLAFTIIFSQAASLLTTFLLIPMLSSRINDTGSSSGLLNKICTPFEKLIDFLHRIYTKALRYVLNHRKRILLAAVALFVVSILVLAQLGMELMPSTDEGTISVSIELPDGAKLDDTDAISRHVEDVISQRDDVETVFATVGSSSVSSLLGSSTNEASITVTLVDDHKKATSEVVEELREALGNIAGAEISIEASSMMSSLASTEVEFSFTGGESDEILEAFVNEAEAKMAEMPAIAETESSISSTKSEIRIVPKTSAASKNGLTTSTLNTLISAALSDTTAAYYTEDGSQYDIVVKYPDNYITDYTELENLRITTPVGTIVTLGEVADISIDEGSTTLTRIDQQRTITLTGTLHDDYDVYTVTQEFQDILESMDVPDGVSFESSGIYDTMIEAMTSLVLAILLGILLMYMIMAAQFESLTEPFIILFTIPLSIIGVVLSLVIAGTPFSVMNAIGILMLVGIIVNNAIVLIDFIKTLREENPDGDLKEQIITAGRTRMRPILMTTLTSILGYLPMALSQADGSEMMRPLATVLLGGLAVGTLLTLFIIPTIYSIFAERKMKRQAKKAAKKNYQKALEA